MNLMLVQYHIIWFRLADSLVIPKEFYDLAKEVNGDEEAVLLEEKMEKKVIKQ